MAIPEVAIASIGTSISNVISPVNTHGWNPQIVIGACSHSLRAPSSSMLPTRDKNNGEETSTHQFNTSRLRRKNGQGALVPLLSQEGVGDHKVATNIYPSIDASTTTNDGLFPPFLCLENTFSCARFLSRMICANALRCLLGCFGTPICILIWVGGSGTDLMHMRILEFRPCPLWRLIREAYMKHTMRHHHARAWRFLANQQV